MEAPTPAAPDPRALEVEPYSAGDLAFHVAGGALCLLAQALAIRWLAGVWPDAAPAAAGLLLSFVAATFAADFISGLLHWAFDTWWSETTPILNRMVVMVREHHVYPSKIFKFGLFHDAGTLSWIMLIATLPLYAFSWRLASPPRFLAYAVFAAIVTTVLVVFMLEFHKAGHNPRPPRWVRALQRAGIVLSTKHHLSHHRGAHDRNYCLIHGHVDRTLGALGMWRLFEWAVHKATGAVPCANDREWLARFGRGPRGEPRRESPVG